MPCYSRLVLILAIRILMIQIFVIENQFVKYTQIYSAFSWSLQFEYVTQGIIHLDLSTLDCFKEIFQKVILEKQLTLVEPRNIKSLFMTLLAFDSITFGCRRNNYIPLIHVDTI